MGIIDTLNASLKLLKDKKDWYETISHYLGVFTTIFGLLTAVFGAILFYYNWKKNFVTKEITKISVQITSIKEKEKAAKVTEIEAQFSEFTRRLILIENGRALTNSKILNPTPRFESYLKNEFNLTPEKLNTILEKQVEQNENLLDKAISLNMVGKISKAIEIFKEITKTSNNNYHLAVSNSFLGSIYLNTEIIENEDPGIYLLKAEELFNGLSKNDIDAILVQEGENYNSLGIYYKRLNQYKASKDNYTKSLLIFDELNKKHPGQYNLDIGMQNHNLYILFNTHKKPNAIDYLLDAYKYKKLAITDDQYSKAIFLSTINTLINHYYSDEFKDTKIAKKYFNESEIIANEVLKNEKELNGLFIENLANIYANYGFNLSKSPNNLEEMHEGISLMIKANSYFDRLEKNNYPLSKITHSNLLHNIGLKFDYLSYLDSKSILIKAINIREVLASSIPGKQYEVALADSYLVISKLYYRNNNPDYKDFAKKAKELYYKYMNDDDSLITYFNQSVTLLN